MIDVYCVLNCRFTFSPHIDGIKLNLLKTTVKTVSTKAVSIAHNLLLFLFFYPYLIKKSFCV